MTLIMKEPFRLFCILSIYFAIAGAAKYKSSLKASRYKRQLRNIEYDLRDCDTIPVYEPKTVVRTDNILRKLREEMRLRDIDAYIIPSTDAHQNEYLADRDQRINFTSGFNGSYGVAIVTRNKAFPSRNKAALWVDPRYFILAQQVLDCNWTSMEIGEEDVLEPDEWLTGGTYDESDERHAQLPRIARVGFDPTLLDIITYFKWNETFIDSPRNIRLIPIEKNLVDIVWERSVGGELNLPEYPGKQLIMLTQNYTGRSWQSKIFYDDPEEYFEYNIRQIMRKKKAEVLVIHKLDEIAWLFNLRGTDIPYSPVFISYCIITNSDIRLYLWDGTKRTDRSIYPNVYHHLELECTHKRTARCISIRGYENFLDDMSSIGINSNKIWHSDETSFAIYNRVRDENRIEEPSPILLMKAQKNDVEIAGIGRANLKDSVALCNLFGWLQEKMDGMAPNIRDRGNIRYLSEQSVAEEAEQIRRGMWYDLYHGPSFATISAFGKHSARLHYEVKEETNIPIHYNGMFIFDSGAHYKEGTTDITRTFFFGKPTEKMINAYTLALMGHIDLMEAKFRSGIYGRELVGIARQPLWSNGFDYNHVTGHGVGHFLFANEGPARIGLGYYEADQPIAEGMVFTDEPGFYDDETEEFGLRIENVMFVKRAQHDYSYSTYNYLEFEPLSLVPFEPRLIDFNLLSRKQIQFYNRYVGRIRIEIGRHPKLTSRGGDWLYWNTFTVDTEYWWKYSTATTQTPHLLSMISLILLAICRT